MAFAHLNLGYGLPFTCFFYIFQESKINYGVRSITCILKKAETKWWNRLLRGDVKPPHYVKVDWDKWVDEDEDNGTGMCGLLIMWHCFFTIRYAVSVQYFNATLFPQLLQTLILVEWTSR